MLFAALMALAGTMGPHGFAFAPPGTSAANVHFDGPPAGRLPAEIISAYQATGAAVRETAVFHFADQFLAIVESEHADKTKMLFVKLLSPELFGKVVERVSA